MAAHSQHADHPAGGSTPPARANPPSDRTVGARLAGLWGIRIGDLKCELAEARRKVRGF